VESELEICILGPLTVKRGGAEIPLPQSRKVRALLGYLVVSPRAVPRSRLSDFLWDIAADRRGELRWCLTKLRGLVDTPQRCRIVSVAGTIRLDLSECSVDARELSNAADATCQVPTVRLLELAALFRGDFLEDLELTDSPGFTAWITAKRRAFREAHIGLLERLVLTLNEDAQFPHLEEWLRIAPFDDRAHVLLLDSFIRRRDVRAGQQHLDAVISQYAAEGIDSAAIAAAWRVARLADVPGRISSTYTADTIEQCSPSAKASQRASVAVMPFVDQHVIEDAAGMSGEAFAHDVITRLAKLRSLFVIAPETVLALRRQHIGSEAAGRLLNIDYVVGGVLRRRGERFEVDAHLTEAATGRLVWSDVFGDIGGQTETAFDVLDTIGNRIVASIAGEIEAVERNRAILKPPSSLNAWEAYHCGLWHMYRFNKSDNDLARRFFEQAIQLDQTFARAHAGLSFTHFQNAFQGWTAREPETDRAYAVASQSLMADDRDPSSHWAMGRALWLRGNFEKAVGALEQSVDLSPNFALAHYTLAFVHAQAGDPQEAIRAADYSSRLSPFDPLLFGMLGARAMALVRMGSYDEAAEWGVKASARPNAHEHIFGIAALCLALAGRTAEASTYLSAIRKTLPQYHVSDFLTAFRFDGETQALFRLGAKRIDLA
jgi:DNA-binding SARP family transcriptional activator/tetratricopeptide (TPR) repeat protein